MQTAPVTMCATGTVTSPLPLQRGRRTADVSLGDHTARETTFAEHGRHCAGGPDCRLTPTGSLPAVTA